MKCTLKMLQQLQWELIYQESEFKGQKPSPEIKSSILDCMKTTNNQYLPQVLLKRPEHMSPEDFQMAGDIFKQHMGVKREAQIHAVSMLMDILKNEILIFPQDVPAQKIIHINADEVLQAANGEEPPQDYDF